MRTSQAFRGSFRQQIRSSLVNPTGGSSSSSSSRTLGKSRISKAVAGTVTVKSVNPLGRMERNSTAASKGLGVATFPLGTRLIISLLVARLQIEGIFGIEATMCVYVCDWGKTTLTSLCSGWMDGCVGNMDLPTQT